MTPADIKQARSNAGLTQSAAAAVVGVTLNAWQKWESGTNPIPFASWELFLLATGQHPTHRLVPNQAPGGGSGTSPRL